MLSTVVLLLASLLPHHQAVDTQLRPKVLPLIVHAKNANTPSLQAGDIELEEDGKSIPVEVRVAPANQPLVWFIVLDRSRSQESEFEKKRAAALQILKALPETDQVQVVAFDTVIERPDSNKRDEALKFLQTARNGGGTAFFDVLEYVSQQARSIEGETNKVLLVFSDGDDNQSVVTEQEAVASLQAASITAFPIVWNRSNTSQKGTYALQNLARQTGGGIISFKDDIDAVTEVRRWEPALRQRIFLAYFPPETAQHGRKQRHALKVKTSRKDVRLLYRTHRVE